MAPISVGIVLLLSMQFVSTSVIEPPSDPIPQLRQVYFDFYACIIQCYRDSFPVACSEGGPCDGNSEISPNNPWQRYPFQQVKDSFYCITKKCNSQVPKYLCESIPLDNSSCSNTQNGGHADGVSDDNDNCDEDCDFYCDDDRNNNKGETKDRQKNKKRNGQSAGSQSSAAATAGSQSSSAATTGSQSSAIATAESQSVVQTYDGSSSSDNIGPVARNDEDDDCDKDEDEDDCDEDEDEDDCEGDEEDEDDSEDECDCEQDDEDECEDEDENDDDENDCEEDDEDEDEDDCEDENENDDEDDCEDEDEDEEDCEEDDEGEDEDDCEDENENDDEDDCEEDKDEDEDDDCEDDDEDEDENEDDCEDDDDENSEDQATASQSFATANSQINRQESQTWAQASSSSGSYANSGGSLSSGNDGVQGTEKTALFALIRKWLSSQTSTEFESTSTTDCDEIEATTEISTSDCDDVPESTFPSILPVIKNEKDNSNYQPVSSLSRSQALAEAASSSGSYANSGNDDQSVLSLSQSSAQSSTGSISNGNPSFNNLHSPEVKTDNWGPQPNILRNFGGDNTYFGPYLPPGSQLVPYSQNWPYSVDSSLQNTRNLNGWAPPNVQLFPEQTKVLNYNNGYNLNGALPYPQIPNNQDGQILPRKNTESTRQIFYPQNQPNYGQANIYQYSSPLVHAIYPYHSPQEEPSLIRAQRPPQYPFFQGGPTTSISASRDTSNNDQSRSGVQSAANSDAFSAANSGGNKPTWVQQPGQYTNAYSGDNIEINKAWVQKGTSNPQQNTK